MICLRVLLSGSVVGDVMSDGATVPNKADGMGCFDLATGVSLSSKSRAVSTDDGGAFALGFGAKDGVLVPVAQLIWCLIETA